MRVALTREPKINGFTLHIELTNGETSALSFVESCIWRACGKAENMAFAVGLVVHINSLNTWINAVEA